MAALHRAVVGAAAAAVAVGGAAAAAAAATATVWRHATQKLSYPDIKFIDSYQIRNCFSFDSFRLVLYTKCGPLLSNAASLGRYGADLKQTNANRITCKTKASLFRLLIEDFHLFVAASSVTGASLFLDAIQTLRCIE